MTNVAKTESEKNNKDGTLHKKAIVPDSVLIPAANKTLQRFKICSDYWDDTQNIYCRSLCGDEYSHINPNWFSKRVTALRKGGKLIRVNQNKARKKFKTVDDYSAEYRQYLTSQHWRSFRETVLYFWDYSCCLCNQKSKLEVHHRTYVRLGNEKLQDCVVLCNQCHKKNHEKLAEWEDKDDSQLF